MPSQRIVIRVFRNVSASVIMAWAALETYIKALTR